MATAVAEKKAAPSSKKPHIKMPSTKMLIDGKWLEADKSFATINPATEEKIADVSQGSDKDIDLAVKAASTTWPRSKFSTTASPSARRATATCRW